MIFIKYICLLLIFLISTEIGFIKARNLNNRTKELSNIQSSLYLFITKIEYTNETIKEIFLQISKIIYNDRNNIFYNTIFELEKSDLIKNWNNSLEKNDNLKIDDKEILNTFGKNLGKLDRNGQINQIKETIELIKKQIKNADIEKEKNEKLYRSLGSIVGIIIILILI